MYVRHPDPLSGSAIRPTTRAWWTGLWNAAILTALVVVLRVQSGPGPESRNSGGSKPLAAIRSGNGAFLSLSWSPDGRTLVTAGIGPSIQTWDADSGRFR